jgi:hypothetical protein
MQSTALHVLERLIEATYTKVRHKALLDASKRPLATAAVKD